MKTLLAFFVLPMLIIPGILLPACSKSGQQTRTHQGKPVSDIKLTCPAFSNGAAIPIVHTCDGDDFSPPLAWEGIPDSAKSICLVCDDPDAPGGTWVHWILFNLPDSVKQFPEALPKTEVTFYGARQGLNDFGRMGYWGPCPPPGKAHRYFFRIYALDIMLPLAAGIHRSTLDSAMTTHVLGSGEMFGSYKRK